MTITVRYKSAIVKCLSALNIKKGWYNNHSFLFFLAMLWEYNLLNMWNLEDLSGNVLIIRKIFLSLHHHKFN